MATPKWGTDILFASGGYCLTQFGVPWVRGLYPDPDEAQAYTFTRADASTCATYQDKDGATRRAAAGKLRLSWVDTDSDGVFETPVLLLEPSRANVCLQSEDFGTTWTAIGSPTRSAGAATIGEVVLDLIGDDAAGAAEGYYQDITFTGDGVKAVSLFVAQGSIGTSLFIRLRDETAGVERLGVTVTLSGSPYATVASVGTVLRVEQTSNGCRILMQTSAVTAANTNRLVVYPGNSSSLTSSDVGNAYVGGVQCEDAAFPSSYIKTTTAAVTRAVDALSFPIGFAPQGLTVYSRFARPAWADASGAIAAADLGLLSIGTSAGRLNLYADDATRALGVEIDTATTDRSATQSLPAGTAIEMCAQLTDPSTGAGTVRLDVGSGFGSASSAASSLTAWSANTIILGGAASLGAAGAGIHKLLICRGSFTLAEMQAVSWPT